MSLRRFCHAALNLVERELGIDAHASAFDVHFSPQLELLPHYMQRQYLAYIKKLHTAQAKFRDTLGVPITPATAAWGDSTDEDVAERPPTDMSAVGSFVWPGGSEHLVSTAGVVPSSTLEEVEDRVDTSSAPEDSSSDSSDDFDHAGRSRSLGFLAEPSGSPASGGSRQPSSAWGEWKSKVIQRNVVAGSKATSTAEQEDATI